MSKTPTMTHAERAERRKDIAEYVKRTGDVAGAVQEFEMSEYAVRAAMREHGVSLGTRGQNLRSGRTMRVIAALRDAKTGASFHDLAEQFEVTETRIRQIYAEAKDNGIDVGEWG